MSKEATETRSSNKKNCWLAQCQLQNLQNHDSLTKKGKYRTSTVKSPPRRPTHSSPTAALPASSPAQKVQCTKIELNQKQIEARVAKRKTKPSEIQNKQCET